MARRNSEIVIARAWTPSLQCWDRERPCTRLNKDIFMFITIFQPFASASLHLSLSSRLVHASSSITLVRIPDIKRGISTNLQRPNCAQTRRETRTYPSSAECFVVSSTPCDFFAPPATASEGGLSSPSAAVRPTLMSPVFAFHSSPDTRTELGPVGLRRPAESVSSGLRAAEPPLPTVVGCQPWLRVVGMGWCTVGRVIWCS